MVAEMAHLITGAAFNPFLRSNQEKCSSLWSAFERLHMSVISDIGDLIDASFRSALCKQPLSRRHHCLPICPVRVCMGATLLLQEIAQPDVAGRDVM